MATTSRSATEDLVPFERLVETPLLALVRAGQALGRQVLEDLAARSQHDSPVPAIAGRPESAPARDAPESDRTPASVPDLALAAPGALGVTRARADFAAEIVLSRTGLRAGGPDDGAPDDGAPDDGSRVLQGRAVAPSGRRRSRRRGLFLEVASQVRARPPTAGWHRLVERLASDGTGRR